MAKETKDVVAEVEPIESIEAEVNEATTATEKTKEKFFTKDRAKRWGKNVLKVGAGAVVGFVGAVVYGMTLGRQETIEVEVTCEPELLEEPTENEFE